MACGIEGEVEVEDARVALEGGVVVFGALARGGL